MWSRLRALGRHLKEENSSPRRLAAAVFVGVLLGVVPLYGLQTLLVIATASVLRLNRVTAVLAAQISIPPIAPFLVTIGISLGEYLRYGRIIKPSVLEAKTIIDEIYILIQETPDLMISLFLGDTILGLVLGAGFGALTYAIATHAQRGRASESTATES